MRPFIGITPDYSNETVKLKQVYIEALNDAGFDICILPVLSDVRSIVERFDGIVISGGDDIHPSCYGEEPISGLKIIDRKRNDFEIMFTEILPNLIPYIIIGFATSVTGAIFAETGLRILGIGPARVLSLGLLIQQALQYGLLTQKRYLEVTSLTLFLIIIFVSLNLINKGMDEVFNPKLKKVTGQ